MKNRSSKNRIISIAIISTCTIPNVIAESRNEINESEQTISDSQEDEIYITGEIAELRSEYSKTYEQSDGSRIAVMSAAPICFYDEENETWEEYDNRLTYNEETETFESEETGSDMQVSLPKNIDEQNNIEVEADGYTVSITPIDMSSSSSKKTNDKKKIKSVGEKSLKKYSLEDYVSDSVLDGKVEYTQDESSKVEYIFSGSGLKENIILSEAPIKNQTYSFRLKADGLTAKLKKDNTIKLLDKDKKAVFVIPAPYMYDSNFSFSDKIKTTLKKEGTEYILTYKPDYKWLTDEERAYPVTIDPTISTKPYDEKIVDTSVLSAASLDLSSNPNLYAGAGGNGSVKMDAYIKFTRLPTINNQWTISNAKLNLKTASDKDNKINAYKITSDWQTSTVKENPPTIESTIIDVCSVPSKANTWVHWDITNTVYDWYNGEENYGIKLSSPHAKNNQSVFYSADTADSENIPYISMEYTTISKAQLENSRTIDIGRAGTATINDFSGNLMLTREDIGIDGNVMPVNISMIYNLNQINTSTFGYCFRTNYSQMISYKSDLGKNKFYEYVCEDGSTVYFDEDEETGEYTDRSGRGYSLTNKGSSDSSYSNIVITDANSYEYSFDKYGRLMKITDTNVTAKSSIEVAYNGDYTKLYEIDYIKDGVGRKYDFSYTDGKLTDISYYGNTNTVLKKVSYNYTNATLTKVTYPDGKSVSYNWNTYCLASAANTDGYSIDFEYTSNSINLPKRVTAVTEYGSRGTKGGDISVEYSPCQTKYINNNSGDTETLVFSNVGDLISTFDSQGAVTVNEYAKSSDAHGVSSLVNTYEHKKSETNLITNGEFESGLTYWSVGSDINASCESTGHPGSDQSVKLTGTPDKTCSISYGVSGIGKKGDTLEIGGWAKANASPQNPFQIKITFHNATRIVGTHTIDFNPYCSEWQYVMRSAQADGDYTHFFIELNYSNQINEAYFDGIVVYKDEKAEETIVSTSEITPVTKETTEPEPVTSIDSDGSIITTEEKDEIKTVSIVDKYGNNLSNDTIVDGISLSSSNEYTYNGNYLKSIIDALGNKSIYSYDLSLGNLNYVADAYGNTVEYTYDKLGNMVKMSQNISGELIEKFYSYDSGNRQSQITHNGFNYDFGYTEFGLLKSIKAGSNKLINYSYNDNGLVVKKGYANEQVIDYLYDTNKNKESIKQNDKMMYSYIYDEYGKLKSIKDDISDRIINYSTTSDGLSVTEETGDGVYHKFYIKENKSIEMIGDKTYTTLGNKSNRIYWLNIDDTYSTYLKKTDKFKRTFNESMYKSLHDFNENDIESSKKTLYNKEYSYGTTDSNKTSDRVSKLTFTGGYNRTINYGYDKNGNITHIGYDVYVYDEAGQLIKTIDARNGNGVKYKYDVGGNIVRVEKLKSGSVAETMAEYSYDDPNWKDLLTQYNGKEITYDEIGNPLTYYNGTEFKWTMGQRLKSAKRSDGVKISYTYNTEGLRTSKTINNVKFDYYWNGDKLTGQTLGRNTMYFRYDGDMPISFEYNGEEYYYITNLQGDIIAILNGSGECVAEYTYDAWGNCTVTKDTEYIAHLNPLRYRGYYYDSDTNLYYLQSRYYDSNIGRFINADTPEMIVNDVLNLYSYCENDPMNNSDKNGSWCYNIKYCAFNNQIKGKMMNRYNKNKKAMNHYYKRMIYAQHNAPITNMGYLDSDLSNTGCEIIATYNSMKRMNKNVFLAGVILEFEMNGMYYVRSGKLGSDPYRLGSYFKAHKVKYDSWYRKSKFLENAKSGKKCGIISFWNNNGKLFWKQGIHTVAYWYDKKTKCYYLPNYNCNETTPKKYTEKSFKKMIESKNNFIIGYVFK